MIWQFLLAAVASMAFSILLQAPRRMYAACAVGGGLSWVVYQLVLRAAGIPAVACFAASLFLTSFARLASVAFRMPVTVFITAGIFPLVPGAGIYYTAYYMFAGNASATAVSGTQTLVVAGTIALGILFGFATPQSWFARLGGFFARKKDSRKGNPSGG